MKTVPAAQGGSLNAAVRTLSSVPPWRVAPRTFPQLPFAQASAYALRRALSSPLYLAHALFWGVSLGGVNASLERVSPVSAFWGTFIYCFGLIYLSAIPWRIRLGSRASAAKRSRAAKSSAVLDSAAWRILVKNGLVATAAGGVLLAGCLVLPFAAVHGLPPALAMRLAGGIFAYIALAASLIFPLVGYGIVSAQEFKREGKRLTARALRMEHLAEEARLVALRAQINPHFFFNALNTIASLIPDRPADAERAVELLASALRPVLLGAETGGERQLASLADLSSEVEVAEAYAHLEQLRFGGRLRVTFSIAPQARGARLPALSLQPLVENAIRYGAPPSGEDYAVAVAARRVESGDGPDGVLIEICNAPVQMLELSALQTRPAEMCGLVAALPDLASPPFRHGHALANVQARLSALCGSGAVLEVRASPSGPAALTRIFVPDSSAGKPRLRDSVRALSRREALR